MRKLKNNFFSNFLNEIKILYKFNHKNIVRIFNYFPYESKYTGYIIMEYIDGIDIGTFINEYCEPFEKVTLNEVFLQLIDAFEYIESHGIIHRDIREGNILIDKNGTVKVIDFGIGKIIEKCDDGNDSLISQINRDGSDKYCVQNPNESQLKKNQTAQYKLLETIAESLEYKDKVTWETIQNPYIPKGMIDQWKEQAASQQAYNTLLNTMANSVPKEHKNTEEQK